MHTLYIYIYIYMYICICVSLPAKLFHFNCFFRSVCCYFLLKQLITSFKFKSEEGWFGQLKYSLKPLLHVETFSWNLCALENNCVAPCNMIGFVKLLRISVAPQVSGKVEPRSTSAKVTSIEMVIKTGVSPCNTTGLAHKFRPKVSTFIPRVDCLLCFNH